MEVSLPPDLEQLVCERLATGTYGSAIEVIGEGLRLLKERDEQREQDLSELRREIQAGLEQLDRGEARVYDTESLREMFEEVKRRGRERLAREQESGSG